MADIIVVGSDVPSGNRVAWYYGGASARVITEDIVENGASEGAGLITLTNKAEYGSITGRTAAGAMTDQLLEFQADGTTAATDASGTNVVRTSASGTATITVHYLDIETTALAQIIGCKDGSSSLDIETSETSVHNQSQKLQLTGAAARSFSIEQVDYNMLFMGAIYGDIVEDSPAAGMTKFTDKYTSVKKLAAVVGKRVVGGVLKKKWVYYGLQVSSIENTHPATDFYAKSMDFTVDSMVETDVVPN